MSERRLERHLTTIGAAARPAVEVGSRLEGERLDTWLAATGRPG